MLLQLLQLLLLVLLLPLLLFFLGGLPYVVAAFIIVLLQPQKSNQSENCGDEISLSLLPLPMLSLRGLLLLLLFGAEASTRGANRQMIVMRSRGS